MPEWFFRIRFLLRSGSFFNYEQKIRQTESFAAEDGTGHSKICGKPVLRRVEQPLVSAVYLIITVATVWSERNGTSRQYDIWKDPADLPCVTLRGYRGLCRPLSRCPGFSPEKIQSVFETCSLVDGSYGACCVDSIRLTEIRVKLLEPEKKKVSLRQQFSPSEIDEVSVAGVEEVEAQSRLEDFILQQDVVVKEGTSSYGHLQFFKTTPEARRLASEAVKIIEASRKLQQRFGLTREEGGIGLGQVSASNTLLRSSCPPQPNCTVSRYRTYDGSCNNKQHPAWGMLMTPFQRILDPDYSDGIWSPRKAADGSELPSPRLVSSSVISDFDLPRRYETLMVMIWGQWVDHDLDLSPVFVFKNGSGIECCTDSGQFVPAHLKDPHCLAIEIPQSDPFYKTFNRKCMNFVRTMPGTRTECNFGYADQVNSITHWMDGSQVYGSDLKTAKSLRLFRKGLLKWTQSPSGKELLPVSENCQSGACFLAGDVRSTEQPQLTVMHTLWLREHNRIARVLGSMNPHWSDDVLFEEARRIVVAELQHITYNEFLPVLLGKDNMEHYGMLPLSGGFTNSYRDFMNPAIFNEFATAAFRMGHSLVQGMMKLYNSIGETQSSVHISSTLLDSSGILKTGWMDAATRGLLREATQNLDSSLTKELTNKLFRGKKPYGFDLVSLNVQRGRDHGLPGYNRYREACQVGKAKTFDDLSKQIHPRMVAALKRLYKSVDDIDLFIGGISETHVPGSMVGPTFLCILGGQFYRLKAADRFFYELGGQPHSFSRNQLNEIRKVTLARIICDNSDGGIWEVQPLVFKAALGANRQVPCNSQAVPRINLRYWLDDENF